jgi:predicted Zn-dependent protease
VERYKTYDIPQVSRQIAFRRDYLVPLIVIWSSDVPERATQAALKGVNDVVAASGQQRVVRGIGPYNGYVERAEIRQYKDIGPAPVNRQLYGPQIDVKYFERLLCDEPLQRNPHWPVLVINRDLYIANEAYFVFGTTRSEFALSVQSVRRFISRSDFSEEFKDASITRTLRHEVGHMFDLPGEKRLNTITDETGTHCTNKCAMRQGKDEIQWAELVKQETEEKILFCKDCQNVLDMIKNRYLPLP